MLIYLIISAMGKRHDQLARFHLRQPELGEAGVRFIPRKIGDTLVEFLLDRGTKATLLDGQDGILVKPYIQGGQQKKINGLDVWVPLSSFKYSYVSQGQRRIGTYPSEEDIARRQYDQAAGTIRLSFRNTREEPGRRDGKSINS
jgi:hypothetical protein